MEGQTTCDVHRAAAALKPPAGEVKDTDRGKHWVLVFTWMFFDPSDHLKTKYTLSWQQPIWVWGSYFTVWQHVVLLGRPVSSGCVGSARVSVWLVRVS